MANGLFFPECLFSRRSRSMRAGSEPQIPQRAGRLFWQQWRRKTQPHMCLCAKNIAGNSSISEALQLASVNFCLVFISILHRFKALLAACSSTLIRTRFTPFIFYSSINHLYLYFMSWILHATVFICRAPCDLFTHRLPFSFCDSASPPGCCSRLVGRALVPNQQRFCIEPRAPLVVSAAEFGVSVLTQLHAASLLTYSPLDHFNVLGKGKPGTALARRSSHAGLMWWWYLIFIS